MSRRGEVKLRWALVDGERVEAMRFVDVPPKKRPVGHCPCCNERIRWQAGNRWREHNGPTPHVSHLPKSTCPTLTSGESAEHFNAKFDLADKLSTMQELKATWFCACACFRKGVVAQGWASVTVEHRSQQTTRVPDVALLNSDGSILLAVEIVHTHAVDDAKAADYAAADIPWIEVSVSDVVQWQPTSTWALKAHAYGNLRVPSCQFCEQIERERPELERLERERLERERLERERLERERERLERLEREHRERLERHRLEREHLEAQAKAESERLREKRIRAERYLVLQEYQTNPPPLRIAIGASVSADGSGAVAAFCKIDFDGPVRVARVTLPWVDSWEDAMKAGIAECIRHLDEKAPGAKVTFVLNSIVDQLNNVDRYVDESSQGRFVRKLQIDICKRGHFVQSSSTKPENPRFDATIASALKRAHDAAESARLNSEAA